MEFFVLFLFHTFNFEINRLLHTIIIVDDQGHQETIKLSTQTNDN